MNWFSRLPVAPRLVIGCGALIVLLFIAAGVGVWGNLRVSAQVDRLASTDSGRQQLLAAWRLASAVNGQRTASLLATSSPQTARQLKEQIEHTSAQIGELQKQVESGVGDAEGRRLLQDLGQLRAAYLDARKASLAAKDAGDADALQAVVHSRFEPALAAYNAGQQRIVEWEGAQIRARSLEAAGAARLCARIVAGLCVAGALFGALFARLMAQSITRPLRVACAAARSVAEGDLAMTIAADGRDEMSTMLRSLAAMQDALRGVVAEVRGGVDAVAAAAGQIAAGNNDLSGRTEQQAASVEEISASMAEMASQLARNAGAAQEAHRVASAAAAIAVEGGTAVARVVATMGEISGASRRIAEIIAVIDGISFQTNILALNAAVEAARAGEQGRGFAVVAGEVRALARRSAQAAREIKQLIGESVERVDGGTRDVGNAGRTIGELVAQVQRVQALISDISSGTSAQSTGIGEVNAAMVHLDRMTQRNAALVEQSMGAANTLNAEATRLTASVARFRLSRDATSAAT